MDIQRWLRDTTDRAPPEGFDDRQVPAFLRSPGNADSLIRKYRRKRKRAASDSSIIAPQPDVRGLEDLANDGRQVGRARPAHSVGRNVDSGSRHSAEGRSPSSDPGPTTRPDQKTYERRARHRTKADRYEPKQKKKGRHQSGDKRASHETRTERRKSKRIRDGGRTAGLVQSFQLKNGPKNQRLTVRTTLSIDMNAH